MHCNCRTHAKRADEGDSTPSGHVSGNCDIVSIQSLSRCHQTKEDQIYSSSTGRIINPLGHTLNENNTMMGQHIARRPVLLDVISINCRSCKQPLVPGHTSQTSLTCTQSLLRLGGQPSEPTCQHASSTAPRMRWNRGVASCSKRCLLRTASTPLPPGPPIGSFSETRCASESLICDVK